MSSHYNNFTVEERTRKEQILSMNPIPRVKSAKEAEARTKEMSKTYLKKEEVKKKCVQNCGICNFYGWSLGLQPLHNLQCLRYKVICVFILGYWVCGDCMKFSLGSSCVSRGSLLWVCSCRFGVASASLRCSVNRFRCHYEKRYRD